MSTIIPKTVYCDQLTFFSCMKIFYFGRIRSHNSFHKIKILDQMQINKWQKMLIFFLNFWNIFIEEDTFFAGHLNTSAGESIWTASRKAAGEIALSSAKEIIDHSHFLNKLNLKWGRNTLLLHWAKTIRPAIVRLTERILIAEALARKDGQSTSLLVLQKPIEFSSKMTFNFCPSVHVIYYRHFNWRLLIQLKNKIKFRTKLRNKTRVANHKTASSEIEPPSLLLLHEGEISLDRSYRTQPHWLFPCIGRPSFRTLILQEDFITSPYPDSRALAEYDVFFVKKTDIKPSSALIINKQLYHRFTNDIRSCFFHFLSTFSANKAFAILRIMLLIRRARTLAVFCIQKNVKAFMTCENYMTNTAAIQLFAPQLGIKTISYQYSNFGFANLPMLTNADTMLTFSSHYHACFYHQDIYRPSLINIGYIYDSSFQLIRERAQSIRRKLKENGADFVICYFDESVQSDKFGQIQVCDRQAEIITLLEKVINENNIALIIKVQFQFNSLKNNRRFDLLVGSAKATGRFIELSQGIHRNIVFPAEAALASDIAIGHSVGGTASLESALVGIRSILINPYKVKGNNDLLYKQCDIVYPSIANALVAIEEFRMRKPERFSLGDWSSILKQFDPFQDGQAGSRMIKHLEDAIWTKTTDA